MADEYAIPLRIKGLAQLFHSLDPSPFLERDFDAEALQYIIDWAQDAPRDAGFAIVVELSAEAPEPPAEHLLADAVRGNFSYRADRATRELRELFRTGQRALLIGLPILAACLAASRAVGAGAGPLTQLLGESLLILGWVANWRPLEIFLYDWAPIVRRRALYRRLAGARVELRRV